jgi:hypothetical protein
LNPISARVVAIAAKIESKTVWNRRRADASETNSRIEWTFGNAKLGSMRCKTEIADCRTSLRGRTE